MRRSALAALVVMAVSAAACAPPLQSLGPDGPVQSTERISFGDRDPLDLHLVKPRVPVAGKPLVLFATGDGGWRGKDKEAFDQMRTWGYPMAGFSAPGYLKHITRHTHRTTPADVAADYARLIARAKAAMALPEETPTVLFGVSRGAGLAVAAAGESSLQPQLLGVVAVALTREEEYVHRLKRPKHAPPNALPELVMLDNYEYLPRLRTLPVSIIQSTHDDYLPAEEARRLLGPDSKLHKLHPIASMNHSFTDARERLYAEMQASLAWLNQFRPPATMSGEE